MTESEERTIINNLNQLERDRQQEIINRATIKQLIKNPHVEMLVQDMLRFENEQEKHFKREYLSEFVKKD